MAVVNLVPHLYQCFICRRASVPRIAPLAVVVFVQWQIVFRRRISFSLDIFEEEQNVSSKEQAFRQRQINTITSHDSYLSGECLVVFSFSLFLLVSLRHRVGNERAVESTTIRHSHMRTSPSTSTFGSLFERLLLALRRLHCPSWISSP